MFASESLPATFAFRAPIKVDQDEEDEDQHMDADDEDAGSDAEFRVCLLSPKPLPYLLGALPLISTAITSAQCTSLTRYHLAITITNC